MSDNCNICLKPYAGFLWLSVGDGNAHISCVVELLRKYKSIRQENARLQGKLERAVEALESVDAYFNACVAQWAKNEGRLVTENGTVIEGSDKVERLCNIAGRKTMEALAELRK